MGSRDQKQHWKSLAERNGDAEFVQKAETEFAETALEIQESHSRRGFLKAAGFTFAGAALAGCSRAPVNQAIPFLIQPEGITPGRACDYASTCAGCTAGCGMLVKTRDGRPIKLEGNPEHPVSRGGLCAVGQASILGLYDSLRLKQPVMDGKPASWEEVDRGVRVQLEAVRKNGGAVRFLTQTVTSPIGSAMIQQFLKPFRDARHVVYDPLSSSAILDAHQQTHGVRALPRHRFDQAEVIVSFDADFLGTWISPVEFTGAYSAGRSTEGVAPRFSYHVQFEGRLSVTGSRADRRVRVAPSELGWVMTQLASRLEGKPGAEASGVLDDLAKRLLAARGRSLLVCGSQEVSTQALCNYLNQLLGNYGATLDIAQPSYQRQGSDTELASLVRELAGGRVAALFIQGVNPAYELPQIDLHKVPLIVSFAERVDETAGLAHYVCPDHHTLESWGDAEPVSGVVSLRQPAIRPLGHTRAMIESLAAWAGAPRTAYEILREYWQANIFPRQNRERAFEAFWEQAVQAGFAQVEPRRAKALTVAVQKPILSRERKGAADVYELVLYAKPGMLDGRHAYNPWLQELPDPISKVTWDNYACLAPAAAAKLGAVEGEIVRLEAQGQTLELPVVVQPGQHEQVVAVAVGYGSKLSERFAKIGPRWLDARSSVGENGLVGRNAAPLRVSARDGVRLARTGKRQALAITQDHHTLSVPKKLAPARGEKRPIIQEVRLADLAGWKPSPRKEEDLWPQDHPYTGHRWAMTVDLNACTGCAACVIACQAENNVPVVGKDEVARKREMHWMRIDRYYSGGPEEVEVAHQPMFCQQCEHASCETVCPVLATVHSAEGLNQQIYNRCVGTRYCANNCPYKARRFNWFHYAREDRLANMVLNPDVTVRSRGVMEKCTFCVQRIQEAKLEAKRRGEPLSDGEIQTACQQSCPARAIVFGDLNDPKSKVSQLMRSGRGYHVLEELNERPSVSYLKVVRHG